MSLYGIKHVFIDGDTQTEDRAKRVQAFQTDASLRVLIFSRIGASGINLAVAKALIFVVRLNMNYLYFGFSCALKDQPWSGQEMHQARGRAHRQPQKDVVRCYHLLADNTADVLLYGLACGKEDMMKAFLSKKSGQGMDPATTLLWRILTPS